MHSMHRFLTGSGDCLVSWRFVALHIFTVELILVLLVQLHCSILLEFPCIVPLIRNIVWIWFIGTTWQYNQKKNELIIFWQLCYFSRAKKLFDTVLFDAVRLCNCWHCNCMHKKILKVDIALNALLFYFRWIQWSSRILAVLYAAIYWCLFGTAAAKLVSSNLHLLP